MHEGLLRVLLDYGQQGSSGAGGLAAMLFPVSERGDFYPDELGKFVWLNPTFMHTDFASGAPLPITFPGASLPRRIAAVSFSRDFPLGNLAGFPLCKRGIEGDFHVRVTFKSPLTPLFQRGGCPL